MKRRFGWMVRGTLLLCALALLPAAQSEGGGCGSTKVIGGYAGGGAESGVDTTKLVKDMTEAEVDAWCTWYFDAHAKSIDPLPDVPLPVDGDVDKNTEHYGSFSCLPDDPGTPPAPCVLLIPHNHCVGSLKAQPCEAPVALLEACVTGLWAGCQNLDDCDQYLAAPGCMRTIVSLLGNTTEEGVLYSSEHPCSVRVQ